MAKANNTIVVLFPRSFPVEEICRIVKEQGCRVQDGHDSSHAAVVIIPRGKRVADYVTRFERLHEVVMVSDSSDAVSAAQTKKIPA